MPEFAIKKILLNGFPKHEMEAEITNSVDFMVEQLESMNHDDLVGRINLHCTDGPLRPEDMPISKELITVIDVCFVSLTMRMR